MYADENVIKIKHAVLLEVAKAAFAGNLDEIRDDVSDLQRVKHQAQTMTAISSR